jgi:hypothetical protein
MMDQEIYVIMPVGTDKGANAKRVIITRCAERHNLIAHFPMDRLKFELDPARALAETTQQILRSRLVLADLSLERPSCYYELGVAEALGARVSIIARTGTDIHQSVNRLAARFYDNMASYEGLIDVILAD